MQLAVEIRPTVHNETFEVEVLVDVDTTDTDIEDMRDEIINEAKSEIAQDPDAPYIKTLDGSDTNVEGVREDILTMTLVEINSCPEQIQIKPFSNDATDEELRQLSS